MCLFDTIMSVVTKHLVVIKTALKEIREKSGYSQEQVAEAVNLSRAAYTNIENFVRRPSPDVAIRIGNFLSFDWTLFFTEWRQLYDAG